MKADKSIGVLLILFSAFMYWQAGRLPAGTFGTGGADFVPKIIFVLLALSGAILAAGAYFKTRTPVEAGGKIQKKSPGAAAKEILAAHKSVITAFLVFFGYVILMYYLGYLIATAVFMPVMMWVLGPRTLKSAGIIAVVTVGVVLGIYVIFEKFLKIFLPSGNLF